MDVLYEESAVNTSAKRGEKFYKILNVCSIIFGGITLIFFLFFLYFLFALIAGGKPAANASDDLLYAYSMVQTGLGAFGTLTVVFGSFWLFFKFWKRRINVSYDYTFVSGELRVAKVFNINHRRFMVKIPHEDMLQVGDVDSDSYDRIKADPTTKEIICTSNTSPAVGKFFMYVHCVGVTGRKLYVLECREELLVQILKFAKRGTLAPDYVMQEKKGK